MPTVSHFLEGSSFKSMVTYLNLQRLGGVHFTRIHVLMIICIQAGSRWEGSISAVSSVGACLSHSALPDEC